MKAKIYVFIYMSEHSKPHLYATTTKFDEDATWKFQREIEIDIGEMPEDFNYIAAQVAALDAKEAELRDELNEKLADIKERKAKLQALEFTA